MRSVDALRVLQDAQAAAQEELTGAEIGLVEATARAEKARQEHSRLEAAVAALSGEPPPAAAPEPMRCSSEEGRSVHTREDAVAESAAATNTPSGREDTSQMTKEEFDAYRKQRQRQKAKEEAANNPYAHIKCSGCGEMGTSNMVVAQAPSGAPIRMMVCGSCGNQNIM